MHSALISERIQEPCQTAVRIRAQKHSEVISECTQKSYRSTPSYVRMHPELMSEYTQEPCWSAPRVHVAFRSHVRIHTVTYTECVSESTSEFMSECTQISFENAHRTLDTGLSTSLSECIQTHSILNSESMLESNHTQNRCHNALKMHVRIRQKSVVACIDISIAEYAKDS